MIDAAVDHLGDGIATGVAEYRERLAGAPVELDVTDRPTVNVVQKESWVELRLRYLVHPRRGTRARNALYRKILGRFDDEPDRVAFPVGRNRQPGDCPLPKDYAVGAPGGWICIPTPSRSRRSPARFGPATGGRRRWSTTCVTGSMRSTTMSRPSSPNRDAATG